MRDYPRRKTYQSDVIGWAYRLDADGDETNEYYTFYKGGKVTWHFIAANPRGKLESVVREVEYPTDCGEMRKPLVVEK